MARKLMDVCDECESVDNVETVRLGRAFGNIIRRDLCVSCRSKPYEALMSAAEAAEAPRRPRATMTPASMDDVRAARRPRKASTPQGGVGSPPARKRASKAP